MRAPFYVLLPLTSGSSQARRRQRTSVVKQRRVRRASPPAPLLPALPARPPFGAPRLHRARRRGVRGCTGRAGPRRCTDGTRLPLVRRAKPPSPRPGHLNFRPGTRWQSSREGRPAKGLVRVPTFLPADPDGWARRDPGPGRAAGRPWGTSPARTLSALPRASKGPA